jgi:hypothetical protein
MRQLLLRRRGDRGSVLPLVIGLVAIVLALVTVVTDVGALWLQRRDLQATVDGAALAGAQAVDLPSVYAGGAQGTLPLDPAEARRSVRSFLAAVPEPRRLNGFRLVLVRVSTGSMRVQASSTATLPFLSGLTGRGITIVAQASASTTTD